MQITDTMRSGCFPGIQPANVISRAVTFYPAVGVQTIPDLLLSLHPAVPAIMQHPPLRWKMPVHPPVRRYPVRLSALVIDSLHNRHTAQRSLPPHLLNVPDKPDN